jgi:hypothetical protein
MKARQIGVENDCKKKRSGGGGVDAVDSYLEKHDGTESDAQYRRSLEVAYWLRVEFTGLGEHRRLCSALDGQRVSFILACHNLREKMNLFKDVKECVRADRIIHENLNTARRPRIVASGLMKSSSNFHRAISFLKCARRQREAILKVSERGEKNRPALWSRPQGSNFDAQPVRAGKGSQVVEMPFGKEMWRLMEEQDMFWPDRLREVYEKFVMECIETKGCGVQLCAPYLGQCVTLKLLSPSSLLFPLPTLRSVDKVCILRYDHVPFAPTGFFGHAGADEELFAECSFEVDGVVFFSIWVEIPLLLRVEQYAGLVKEYLRDHFAKRTKKNA